MKISLFIASFLLSLSVVAAPMISESVYVESPTDSDQDGVQDRIYVSVSRPDTEAKISSIYEISPYSLGSNGVENHNVDMPTLPQDSASFKSFFDLKSSRTKKTEVVPMVMIANDRFVFATVKAHSLGTGKSTGCPTIGDEDETKAAKAVIDWLNGRAKGWSENGNEVKAEWSNGRVGMTGVSYNGTLPIMVASTGVEGLKAIIPIAAISNWYDYYRANGLVVNPGGYVGEDADVLGYFVVRKGYCKAELELMTKTQGRENGDFTPFWAARNHLANAKNFKAATFIIHGQSDWNVKQKNAIQLWEALDGLVPRRMILHRGGHSMGSAFNVTKKVKDWFAFHLDGIQNGINQGPMVEVEHPDGSTSVQDAWPHEKSKRQRFYLDASNKLSSTPPSEATLDFEDLGSKKKIDSLMTAPDEDKEGRLIFLSDALTTDMIFTGTPKMSLRLSVKNRSAANLTVAIVEYRKFGQTRILTRGWADPQNHQDMARGEKLVPGKFYDVVFDLEPKQQRLEKGSQFGILVASTDYDYTLRPATGTILEVMLGEKSFIDLMLAPL